MPGACGGSVFHLRRSSEYVYLFVLVFLFLFVFVVVFHFVFVLDFVIIFALHTSELSIHEWLEQNFHDSAYTAHPCHGVMRHRTLCH